VDEIENDDYASQLRSLRLLLGKNFRPISTDALAELTNIPVVSIRGIEAGRRQLNDDDRLALDIHLGAYWDLKSRQWLCVWQEQKGVPLPFTRQKYEVYSAGLIESRTLVRPNITRIGKALQLLAYNLEEKQAAVALIAVHRLIVKLAEENNLGAEVIASLRELQPELKFKTIKQLERDKALADLEDAPKSVQK
jgi:hypothetical protein